MLKIVSRLKPLPQRHIDARVHERREGREREERVYNSTYGSRPHVTNIQLFLERPVYIGCRYGWSRASYENVNTECSKNRHIQWNLC